MLCASKLLAVVVIVTAQFTGRASAGPASSAAAGVGRPAGFFDSNGISRRCRSTSIVSDPAALRQEHDDLKEKGVHTFRGIIESFYHMSLLATSSAVRRHRHRSFNDCRIMKCVRVKEQTDCLHSRVVYSLGLSAYSFSSADGGDNLVLSDEST